MSATVFKSEQAAAAVEAHYRQVLQHWPVASTQMHLQTRQGPTFVVACGPQDAPPVLLLHGSQANAAAWIPDVALWSTKFRLYAVDMIGEAGLSAQVRPSLAGDAHTLWLDDVLAGLSLAGASIVGTSLGGWLALDYASRRPQAVRALALISPAGIGRQKNFLLKALPLLLLGLWGQRKMRELVFGPPSQHRLEKFAPIAALMETIATAIKPRVVQIPRLSDSQLAGLTMPILAIMGGRDVLFDAADTRDRLRSAAPQARICFIEDGYHFLPDQTVCVLEFLEQALASAAS